LYLSKLAHVLQSSGVTETTVPVDRLCDFAEIHDQSPGHKKQNLTRAMYYLQDKGKLAFHIDFVAKPAYQVRLRIFHVVTGRQLQVEHSFYFRLIGNLRAVFETTSKASLLFDEDPFQAWLADSSRDLEIKAQVLAQAYYASVHKSVSVAQARSMILSGEFA